MSITFFCGADIWCICNLSQIYYVKFQIPTTQSWERIQQHIITANFTGSPKFNICNWIDGIIIPLEVRLYRFIKYSETSLQLTFTLVQLKTVGKFHVDV